METSKSVSALRTEKIGNSASRHFDLIVVGGGVHGAFAAWQAAIGGMAVLLLEARDFAGATSSRSSKLLHGGIRYLEQGSFSLIRQGLTQRSEWLRIAPHLTRPLRFLFPVLPRLTRPAWQISAGLAIYDLLSFGWRAGHRGKNRFPNHCRLSSDGEEAARLSRLGLEYSSLFQYYDGQMDDARLVIEAIVDLEKRGGIAFNYAEAESIERVSKGWKVRWRCGRSGQCIDSEGSYLINCGGPWSGAVHRLAGAPGAPPPPIIWSRGVHLYFKRRWEGPGLILPTGEPGRIYWVLPFFDGGEETTFVGTTDRPAEQAEHNPQATTEEQAELLGFLGRDLPQAGFSKDQIIHTICGLRTLVGTRDEGNGRTSAIKREEQLIFGPAYSALFGGKYTTALYTSRRLLDPLLKLRVCSGVNSKIDRLPHLPGAAGWSSSRPEELKRTLMANFGAAPPITEDRSAEQTPFEILAGAAVFCLGARAAELMPSRSGGTQGEPADPASTLVEAWLEFAAVTEQAWRSEDFLERRLPLFTLTAKLEPEEFFKLQQTANEWLEAFQRGE